MAPNLQVDMQGGPEVRRCRSKVFSMACINHRMLDKVLG